MSAPGFRSLSFTWLSTLLPSLLLLLCLLPGCPADDPDTPDAGAEVDAGTPPPPVVTGKVVDGDGAGIAGAKVMLIPNGLVDTTPLTAEGILDGTTEDRDEPLEDLARGALSPSFPQAITDSEGSYRIEDIPEGRYFFYAQPENADFLPGGDQCLGSFKSEDFFGTTLDIRLSSVPPADATYVSSDACQRCHDGAYGGHRYTAHALGISKPFDLGAYRSADAYPWYDMGLEKFVRANDYLSGTVLTVGDYDGSRGFDKFEIYEDASRVTVVLARMYLWLDVGDGNKLKITVENVINPADPNSPATFPVEMTYGGTLFKQRFLVNIPESLAMPARQGSYPLLQYQGYPGGSQGKDTYYDRGRAIWRDYHLDWYWGAGADSSRGTSDDLIVAPPTSKTFERNCAGCHFTGIEPYQDPNTGEWLADAVDNINGGIDIDGDGTKDEVNIGCEVCHGPGSAHVAVNDDDNETTAYIVAVGALSPSRQNMICGFCHDRSTGSSANMGNDVLWDANDQPPHAGASREHMIAEHLDRKGPKTSHFWEDKLHSVKHHQQYSDFLKSKKHANPYRLMVCSDCHDLHALRQLEEGADYEYNLTDDQENPWSDLCMRCHERSIDPLEHSGHMSKCSSCHMPRTGKTGAGRMGVTLETPTGQSSDVDRVYWNNDISSHVFDVITKEAVGVAGKQPGKAMPSSYTNACGSCHDLAAVPYSAPVSP